MQVDFDSVITAPFGCLGIRAGVLKGQEEQGEVLKEIVYLPPKISLRRPDRPFLQEVVRQLENYLDDPHTVLQLPHAYVGTAFQNRVWDAISQIPTGETRSYGEIAKAIRSGPRAVGGACGANFFPILIPCHRVLAAQGIGGFAKQADGFYTGIKKWLLKHEGIAMPNT